MQACLTVHSPDRAAIVATVGPDAPLRIGRGDDSGLRIEHPSISRAHAELCRGTDGWVLRDLGSKNGSFVDGTRLAPREPAVLRRASWLRFGDVYCEFAQLDPDAAAQAEAGRRARRAAAHAHTARIEGVQDLGGLLDASLRGVLELAQCERGFVLLAQDEGAEGERHFTVRSSIALDATRLRARAFSGSVGAVRRALESARSVVVNEVADEAWLASRASVVAAGLTALVCVPLLEGGEVLGAIYADRTGPGAPITTLDQELLEAFAERAALWLSAHRMHALLDALPAEAEDSLDWRGIEAAHAGASS